MGGYVVVRQVRSSSGCDDAQLSTLRSLRLDGIGKRHRVHLTPQSYGMLHRVRHLIDVRLVAPPAGGAAAVAQRVPMPRMTTTEYETQDGRALLVELGDGEELTVERHGNSWSVLWSCSLPAPEALRRVAELLPSSGLASFSTLDESVTSRSGQPLDEVPSARISELVDEVGDSLTFARLDYKDRAVTWEVSPGKRKRGRWLARPGEMGLMAAKRDDDYLVRVIEATATPLVVRAVHELARTVGTLLTDVPPARMDPAA